MSYPADSRYRLYEETVQSPLWKVNVLPELHRRLTGKTPVSFREDFCGSARIACEWVRKSPRHRALGLDIDREVLRYAEEVNRAGLPAGARARLKLARQDVLKPTRERFDLIGAFNFSFFDFHERAQLLRYARAARASLKPRGALFLELAGGQGFLEPRSEESHFKVRGLGKVKRVWEQHDYDPVTSVCDYSIHFQLPGGRWLNDAFTYHWRVWGIRETRECLLQAGFRRTAVLWEKAGKRGEGTGQFVQAENGENHLSWVSYVVGLR